METLSDISKQEVEIGGIHGSVSVELVQNLKVQLQLESDDARETIKAELFSSNCGDSLPCPSLSHHVLHTDSQSFVTFTVHPGDQDQRFISVTLVLVSILSCVLLTWIIRKWMKWKHIEQVSYTTEQPEQLFPDCSDEIKTKDRISSAKEPVVNSKEILHSENVSGQTDESLIKSSSSVTMTRLQASGHTPWIVYSLVVIGVCCTLGMVVIYGAAGFKHSRNDLPVLKLTFPGDKHIRHIRSYSEEPSIRDVSMNKENKGSGLLTRLQLLDLSPDCRSNLTACQAHALCDTDSPGGDFRCRCRRGYFLKDLSCIPCQTSCKEGHFMEKQCSANGDVICRECTQCVGSSYEVAVCTSTQDTICIDVTFPLKQFQSNALPIEDLVSWNVTLSKNVFLERLQSIKKLETTLYLSSNKQALQFVWRRPNSGLEIHVKASDVYLIPEYVDVDHIGHDDEKFVMKANTFPEDIKNLLRSIRRSHCRHPLPDEYELNLDIAKNIATPAREFPCDTKNRNGPECPHGYKDGDMYVYQILDRLCPKVDTTRSQTFGYSSNNILCSGNTEMLKSIFNMEVDDPTFLNFPSEECKKSEENCGRCLSRDACDRGSNLTDCCNIGCHQLTDCKRYFSAQCPNAPIECARGDITKFSIMPRYPSLKSQFSCHMRHSPPQYLYQLSYEVKIPSMQDFSLGTRKKNILYRDFLDQNSTDLVDYLIMRHHTETKYDDEVILTGRFRNRDPNNVEDYTLHKLKTSHTFDRYPGYNLIHRGLNKFRTRIQFETPFLYSTDNWHEYNCSFNESKIYPAQPIYENYGRLVKPVDIKKRDGKFNYQILSESTTPHTRFYIQEDTSILSYYRDTYQSVRINPWDLQGSMSWDPDTYQWNITLAGSLTACPGIFTLEIYTANMATRLVVYDMVINCPQEFSASFEIKRNSVDFVDIFVAVLNDSVSSYRTVLSSVQGPQYFKAAAAKAVATETGETPPWPPMVIIVAVCFCASVVLIMLYLYCDKKKSKFIPTDITVPKPDLGPQITLLQSIDKVNKEQGLTIHTKFIMMTLVVLYVIYALMFSFTALFALFHVIQGPNLGQVTLTTNTSEQVQFQMQRTLDTIIEYENKELDRLLRLTEQRITACSNHMKSSLRTDVPSGNHKLRRVLLTLFRNNGTVDKKLSEYFHNRQSFYQNEISKFLDEFNRTLDTKLHKLQISYLSYLKSVAENQWFTVPKEIFMQQQILSGRPIRKITDDLPGFLTWLEIDKVQELFEMKDMIMTRLLKMMPSVDFTHLVNKTENFDPASVNVDFKPSENTFKFSYNNPDYISSWNFEDDLAAFPTEKPSPKRNKLHISNIKGIIYPVFICAFLLLDSLLLIYRFSWMVKSLKMFKTGLEERIPYDSMTRKIYFILTGKEVPRPEDSLDHPYDYYMHNKENIWGDNTELYFMYCTGTTKAKEEILREIWHHKQQRNPKQEEKPSDKNCLLSYFISCMKSLYRLLISPVFWRMVFICGFVLILFLVAKATNDLVTLESAMFLLDTGAMLPILERQNDITNTVISEYSSYLNDFLVGYKEKLDGEVQTINSLLLNVAERQNMLLNTMISDMCNLAGLDACTDGTNLVTMSLTSCNFLPIHSKMFEGFQKSVLLEYIQKELSPLVLNLRSILFSSMYLLLTCAAAMLLCQITARVIYIHLKNSRHVKITKIYQLPSSVNDQWQDTHSLREKEMYNSQSVIAESCESGVYDMTN